MHVHDVFEARIFSRLIIEEIKKTGPIREEVLFEHIQNGNEYCGGRSYLKKEFNKYANDLFHEALGQLEEEHLIEKECEGQSVFWKLGHE